MTALAIGVGGMAIASAAPAAAQPVIAKSSLSWDDTYYHYILTPSEAAGRGRVSSQAFAETVENWHGVVDVTPLANGLVSVRSTSRSTSFEAHPEVAQVDVDTLLELGSVAAGQPNDADFGSQWMLNNTGASAQAGGYPGIADADTDAPEAWASTTGAGVIVADVDSGVDIYHPDLVDRIWRNAGEVCGDGLDNDSNGFVDDCHGWDTGDNDGDPRPTTTTSAGVHGTHVAGIIGATGDNRVGIIGMAPDVTIMPLKVSTGGDNISVSGIYNAIIYAVDNGADIINASFGTTPGEVSRGSAYLIEEAVAYAQQHGVLFVTAAGNNGVDIDDAPVWPASLSRYYDNVLTVGASTNSDTRASFSNYGSDTVGIYAPGWFINSTVPGNAYASMSGTSMASPAVAGGAALVAASAPTLTPAQIIARLQASTDSASELNATAQSGRLNLANAVNPPTLEATFSGWNSIAPDNRFTGAVTARLNDNTADTAFALQATVLTTEDDVVYAVAELPVAVGTRRLLTNDQGQFNFPNLSSADLAALKTGTWSNSITTSLPAGNYALSLQLVTSNGTLLGNSSILYFVSGDRPLTSDSGPVGGVPGETGGSTGEQTGSQAGSNTASGGEGAPTNTGDAGQPNGLAGDSTTGAGVIPGGTPANGGSASADGNIGTPSGTGTGTGNPTGDAAAVGQAGDSSGAGQGAVGGSPAGSTGGPSANEGTNDRGTETDEGVAPGGVTTPVTQNGWTIRSVSPSFGPISGGTRVRIEGYFPRSDYAFVSFGGVSALITGRSQYTLLVIAPPHEPGSADVMVGSGSDVVTATAAFFYVDPNAPGVPTSAGASNGNGTTSDLEIPAPGNSEADSTSPATATAPGPAAGNIAVRPTIFRGNLKLIKLPTSSPLAKVSPSAWSTNTCGTASCAGAPLRR